MADLTSSELVKGLTDHLQREADRLALRQAKILRTIAIANEAGPLGALSNEDADTCMARMWEELRRD